MKRKLLCIFLVSNLLSSCTIQTVSKDINIEPITIETSMILTTDDENFLSEGEAKGNISISISNEKQSSSIKEIFDYYASLGFTEDSRSDTKMVLSTDEDADIVLEKLSSSDPTFGYSRAGQAIVKIGDTQTRNLHYSNSKYKVDVDITEEDEKTKITITVSDK